MPFVIKFVEQGKGIEFRGSGFLTEDELVEARTELQSDTEAMRRVTFALIDLENVVELRLDREGVRRLVGIDEHLAKLTSGMAVAIVAASDHTFGLARMWEVMVERTGWPIRVVRSHPEAHAWLVDMLARRSQSSDAPIEA